MNCSTRVLLCAALAATGALAAHHPAQAAPPAACVSSLALNPAKWQWVLNFDQMAGGNPVACMAAMEKDNTVTYTTTECKVIGAVAFGGGAATFNGGHVRCEFDPPESGNASYGEFEIYARARNLQNAPFPGGNPIFEHPDAFLYAPAAGGGAGITSWMQPGLTTIGPVGGAWTRIWARAKACKGEHIVATRKIPVGAPCKLGFSLEPQVVTVGLSKGGAALFGQLTEVTVDPKWGKGD